MSTECRRQPTRVPIDGRAASASILRDLLRRPTALGGTGGFPPQLVEKRCQERTTRLLVLATAGPLVRAIPEHLGDTVARGELGNHLAGVGGRAEQPRIEWNGRDRLTLDRLGEASDLDFRSLVHADLIETIK